MALLACALLENTFFPQAWCHVCAETQTVSVPSHERDKT